MLGSRFAHYEVLEKLGSGGMGDVYRARDRNLGRDVAVKFLPPRLSADPGRLARFEQEARAASALNHPNIVTIHEVGRLEGGGPYIVMELIRGQTLRSLLDAGRPLVTRRALELAAQAAEGLAKAHAAGIVHRDLKPENLMVSDDGFLKILDFGLVKLTAPMTGSSGDQTLDRLERAETQTDLSWATPDTDAGTLLGTAGYMSPEQARGQPVDFRADQFACGAILYEVATGKRAFHRDNAVLTLAAIIESEPEPIVTLNPGCPAPFRWIIERCLKKDPEDRYASTLDLARELRTVCNRLEEASTGSSGPSPRTPPVGARLGPWTAALGAVIAAAALLAGPLRDPIRDWLHLWPVPREKHVAILPLAGASGDEASRAFSDGLVETLASQLSQIEGPQGSLWVVPMSEVRDARVTSAAAARRAFGVTLVVTGSLQRAGDRVRLSANLVDALTLRQLRSMPPLEATVDDLALLQGTVAASIARMLELELDARARRVIAAGGTRNAPAYDLYLKGRGYLARYENPESLDQAVASFQQAIQQDSSFALAYAGLGEAYWRQYELASRSESVELAQKACRRALAINDLLAPVHVTLGLLHVGTGHAAEAVEDFQRALALDPVGTDARLGLARAQTALGRLEEAEAGYQKAIGQRPDYWGGHNDLGKFYYAQQRYTEAVRQFRRVIELTPDNARGYSNLGGIYHLMGRYDEALDMLQRSLSIRPTPEAASNVATLEFFRGRYEEAARAFEKAVKLGSSDYQLWYNLAAAYYWAPDLRDKAAAAYGRAIALAEEARKTNPRDASLLAVLADCYGHLGRAREARQLVAEALRLAPADGEVLFRAACLVEFLGDRARALALVTRAMAGGYSKDEVARAPDLEALRADPRFKTVTRS